MVGAEGHGMGPARTMRLTSGSSASSATRNPDYGDFDVANVNDRIQAGQKALREIRLRLSVTLVALSITLAVAYIASLHTWLPRFEEMHCGRNVSDHLLVVLSALVSVSRLVCVGVLPVLENLWVSRAVLVINTNVVYAFLPINHVKVYETLFYQWDVWTYIVIGCKCGFVVGVACALCCGEQLLMQKVLWESVFWFYLGTSVPFVHLAIQGSLACGRPSVLWWFVLAVVFFLVMTRRPQMRDAAQASFRRMLTQEVNHRAAAGIAGLVGACSTKYVLSEAKLRFRSIQLTHLAFADIADNRPNPGLSGLAAATRLGACDAFVSHSWHDEPAAKWAALQAWRGAFLANFEREPKLWLDKCCIDQNNIDADLRCLPIFLSGCRRLVVLCGATYLSRLWCIMELFTFVHMGRSLEDVDFVPVFGPGDRDAGRLRIRRALREFDADLCRCSCPEDREKMLSVIRAAFGTMAAFNEAVRTILASAVWDEPGDELGDELDDDGSSETSSYDGSSPRSSN